MPFEIIKIQNNAIPNLEVDGINKGEATRIRCLSGACINIILICCAEDDSKAYVYDGETLIKEKNENIWRIKSEQKLDEILPGKPYFREYTDLDGSPRTLFVRHVDESDHQEELNAVAKQLYGEEMYEKCNVKLNFGSN
jgi:hypothetical protein